MVYGDAVGEKLLLGGGLRILVTYAVSSSGGFSGHCRPDFIHCSFKDGFILGGWLQPEWMGSMWCGGASVFLKLHVA